MTTARNHSPRHRARLAVGLLATGFALALGACGSDDGDDDPPAKSAAPPAKSAAPAEQAVKVDIADFKFKPDPIKVKVGGTVTFVNLDKAPHTAQTELNVKAAEFDTGRLAKGDEKAVTVKNAGKFDYFCVYHRFMEGTVEVVE